MRKAVVAPITGSPMLGPETPKLRADSDEARAYRSQTRCNMSTNATTRLWRTSLARSAVVRAVGLSIIGFSVWLWFTSADGSAWKAASLVAVLALAALAGVVWYLPRARAERRWRAALDHYAEQELEKRKDLSKVGSGAALPR
jgi:hypothetical protein